MQRLFYVAFLSIVATVQQEKPKADDGSVSAILAEARRAPQAALSDYNILVGEWRGTGLPKRGSNRGGWTEKSQWKWNLADRKLPALSLTTQNGKLVRQAWLRFDGSKQHYTLEVKFVGEQANRRFTAIQREKEPDGEKPVKKPAGSSQAAMPAKLVFVETKAEEPAGRYRITLQVRLAKRVTLLIERGKTVFRRVAEIGYTRKGESLVDRGSGQPECIVTGGAGTIRVSHKGKTYLVCCTGCQQAFEDDPEGVLADYHARLKEEKSRK